MAAFYVQNEIDNGANGHTFVALFTVPATKTLFIQQWSSRWVYAGSAGTPADSVRWGYSAAGASIDTELDASIFVLLPVSTSSRDAAPYATPLIVPAGKVLTIDLFLGAVALTRISNAFHGVLV